ncbi:hypothetical protein M3G91_32715 [Micromonospora chalcea]|uniref:hypothetical protein n=1 Tax=Micromonospora chalcea TaxID=1874 RepID=UPI0021A6D68E|nr:hypothetical protein [Micromonospora chalcea]MCT2282371.1 hypothetical protein [Micromonospora chalcea]
MTTTAQPAARTGEWWTGDTPWLRRADNRTVTCLWCGSKTAIASWGDEPEDTGRIELYCENSDCEVREVALIVTRDGHTASARADVRALDAIDVNLAIRHSAGLPLSDLRKLYEGATARRMDTSALRPAIPCPACSAPSHYITELDRYAHADGSDNQPCWLAITRGQTR